MQKVKKILVRIAIAFVIVLLGVFSFYYWGTYSEGYRSGIVMKISTRGVIFKTTEGQMNMQVIGVSDIGTASQVWDFSVDNDKAEIIEAIRQASLSGERVELYYIQRYMKFPWRGESEYFVRKVVRAKK
jgi:uncharacterized protein YwgA